MNYNMNIQIVIKLIKEVKNKDYTGVGYQIGENTGNSTAGFTRYRS